MKLTLGIQSGHESSAALLNGTELVAAVSDERLTRLKNDGGRLMNTAIDAVLNISNYNRTDIDTLALLYTFFPDEYFRRESWAKELERKIVRLRRSLSGVERPQMLLGNFVERLESLHLTLNSHFRKKLFLRKEGFPQADTAFYDHHDSHAIAAAYYSGFKECAVITIDGLGDKGVHHTSGIFVNGAYQRIHASDNKGSSAGMFYSHITELLGFRPMRHEGKVVGLAALGDTQALYEPYLEALTLTPDKARLSSSFIGENAEEIRVEHLRRVSENHSREDISAAAQQVIEDVVVKLIQSFLQQSNMRSIALNGGVFANVKLNQRIAELDEVEKIFIFPAMSDTGNSVGACLLDLFDKDDLALINNEPLTDVYLGPSYSDKEIEKSLIENNLPVNRLSEEDLIKKSAQSIDQGLIVGWFQGRMEFGPRALGNRSMLARPTESDINNWLNERLGRSEFMPFAPSVLAEEADNIFINVEKSRHTAEFMTITYDVRPEWQSRISAVVHVDGTARPQLVRKDRNPRYHKLISKYHAISGIPMVLNTSFNAHEEPIVCAPTEAITAFIEKRIDCLAIGDYWLSHKGESS